MPARLLLFFLFLLATPGMAQGPVHVVMLSDLHFDPFHNPSQLASLRAQSVDQWPAIFAAAPAGTDAARLGTLQTACPVRAPDTPFPLLQASLAAAHDANAHPLFVTLSGDLLAHGFACRFFQLSPGATPEDLAAFAAKTVTFVLAQFREAFPRVPVYASLGNNDSGCEDYRGSAGDSFLEQASAALRTATLNPALVLTPEGDYSTPLPPPLENTRLVVLEDTFSAQAYRKCDGTPDRAAERDQLRWLRAQLADARTHNQHVWFMSHIPPGVDVLNSFRRYVFQPANLCQATPHAYLADTALADALLDNANTVRLALFGHTHMDEMRVLARSSLDPATPASESASGSAPRSASSPAALFGSLPAAIAAKLVPSISPFAGNHPAFLVAQVDPRTAILTDWRTIVSPGPQGSAPPWAEGYRYSTAFHLPDFSAASALQLADSFVADKTGQAPGSVAFRQHFYPGDLGLYALGLAQIWPAYACSVREDRPSAVHRCICAAVPPATGLPQP